MNRVNLLKVKCIMMFHCLFIREKKKELEREELWRKLDDLQMNKALADQQKSPFSVQNNTSAK